jgi:molecular chaperone DnaK (HSP70)
MIGEAAQQYGLEHPEATVSDALRFFGQPWSSSFVDSERASSFPHEFVDKDGRVAIQVMTDTGAKAFAPSEVLVMLLRKMKRLAQSYLSDTVSVRDHFE